MPRLLNAATGEVVAQHVGRAAGPWERVVGYLGRRVVDAGEGLWFDRCSMIHTLGMRASIDVVFVDTERRIVRVISRAHRNRVFYGGARAAAVVELGPGVALAFSLALGQRLELE